uniref:Uncharacterized protein n=1 Tax=Arundo donax TaxID=35708 RepID=A0A0A9D0T6_ARUDO
MSRFSGPRWSSCTILIRCGGLPLPASRGPSMCLRYVHRSCLMEESNHVWHT